MIPKHIYIHFMIPKPMKKTTSYFLSKVHRVKDVQCST